MFLQRHYSRFSATRSGSGVQNENQQLERQKSKCKASKFCLKAEEIHTLTKVTDQGNNGIDDIGF